MGKRYVEVVQAMYPDRSIIRVLNNGDSYDDIVWNALVTPPTRAEVDAAVSTYNNTNIGVPVDGSINIINPVPSGQDGVVINGNKTWEDVIGVFTPRTTSGSTYNPSNFIGGVYSWPHAINYTGDIVYHMPHSYAPGTDLYLHMHWGHQGTSISGSFVVSLVVTHAKRTSAQDVFSTPITTSLSITGLNITNTPRYSHRIDEIQLSTPGGASNMLNTDDIGVDSLIMVRYTTSTIPSISGGVKNQPFIFASDLHIQTNVIGTPHKDPDYYN